MRGGPPPAPFLLIRFFCGTVREIRFVHQEKRIFRAMTRHDNVSLDIDSAPIRDRETQRPGVRLGLQKNGRKAKRARQVATNK